MIETRVLFFVAAVCLGFAAWNLHLHPSTSYNPTSEMTNLSGIRTESCPSVWDRWTDNLPPTSNTETPQQLNNYGPTLAVIKRTACGAAIVGREHISETWLAAGGVAFLIGFGLWWRTEG